MTANPRWRRLAAACGLALGLAAAGCGKAAVTVNGEGATFVEPVMKEWAADYADKTATAGTKVVVNYQGKGSGAGVSQMTKRLADFGCTDMPMSRKNVDEAMAAGGPVIHVPLVIGAVVPVYNLPGDGDKPVAFSGPVLADIFTGKITRWNDPKLAALNPGVPLPDTAIQPVYRADPSGTSFIFADYLAKVSPGFGAAVGVSNTPKWPAGGIAQGKSDGVAGHVSRTPGAIGYIELTFALDTGAKYGAVVNQAGKSVRADLASITAAAAASAGVKPTAEPYSLHELTYSLTDAPGEASYPIAGMSFAVLYESQPTTPGKAVVDFLTWATSAEGQMAAQRRNYAPLPAELQAAAARRLAQVTFRP